MTCKPVSRIMRHILAASALACVCLPAAADTFVTGAGISADGNFTLAGRVNFNNRGFTVGKIVIVEQLDSRDGNLAGVMCNYSDCTNFSVNGNVATFNSAGLC